MTPRRLRFDRLECRDVPSIAFRFDYSLDSTGFFNDPERRAALEQAGFMLTSQLNDSLAAIAPGGTNSLTLTVTKPGTNQTVTLINPAIAADEIVVYAIGANLGGTHLGATGATSYRATGTTGFVNAVTHRGQNAALTESSPWGGIVGFNQSKNWYFGSGTLDATEYDFVSVAAHELMHVLGFGAGNPEFDQFVSGHQYVGPNASAIYGRSIPMEAHDGSIDHWAAGTTSYGAAPLMLGDLTPGTKRTVTAIDLAALADIGWQVDLVPTSVTTPALGDLGPVTGTSPTGQPQYTITQPPSAFIPVAAPSTTAGPAVLAIGAAEGQPPTVTGYDAAGKVAWTKQAFESTMTGGVRVAMADFNADGTLDIVTGTGPGVASRVRVFDGKTGNELFAISPFESRFTGGVYIAAGDITGDGKADLAISAGNLGGPRVRLFGGTSYAPLADFFAIEDTRFRGGTRPALADLTGDGKADLLVAAGLGGGPRVAAFDGASIVAGQTPRKFASDFFGGDVPTSDGAYLAVGDTNGDRTPDLVVSAGGTVTVYDGKTLGRNGRATATATFRPATADSRAGARIAVADVSGDGQADVLTFAGFAGTATQVAAYSPATMRLLGYDLS
jgi:hypothetical protein